MPGTPELVLFDMDNVLCDYSRRRRCERLASIAGTTPEAVHAAIWDSGFELLGDSGALDAAAYLKGFGERIGHALTLGEWLDARAAAMAPDRRVLGMVRRLRDRSRIAVLTNNTTLVRDHLDRLCPEIRELFGDHVHASAAFRIAKPDPDCYRRCLNELGGEPGTTLFVDDLLENVRGAREAGLLAHHYRSPRRLEAELGALGLL